MKISLLKSIRNRFIEIFLVENQRMLGIWLGSKDLVLLGEGRSQHGSIKGRMRSEEI